VVEPDHEVQQLRTDTGEAEGEVVDPQGESQTTGRHRQRLSDAGRVAEDQVLL
jgi:hypothetical protein